MNRTDGRHPTLREVAERAGVSRGTASWVVNDTLQVGDHARKAVIEAMDELGYVPGYVGQAPAADRIGSVALIVPEMEKRLFSEPYFSAIIHGVAAELSETDTQLLLIMASNERERVRLARYLEAHAVDGVLLVSVHGSDTLPELIERLAIPAVLGGRRSETEPLSCVQIENIGGARNAVDCMLSRGCHKIATITGDLDQEGARARLEGYRQAMEEAGMPYDEGLVGLADFSEETGAAAMTALLDRRPDLDGVFAASDPMAIGAMRVLREAGRAVPDDVAVVGFDDSEGARLTDPPLTSVRQPTEEMGHTMARLLLDEIAEPRHAQRQIALGTELIRRGSA